ncbi:hypothetical protein KCV03_g393, partial [Aureobasidium melanogenum]
MNIALLCRTIVHRHSQQRQLQGKSGDTQYDLLAQLLPQRRPSLPTLLRRFNPKHPIFSHTLLGLFDIASNDLHPDQFRIDRIKMHAYRIHLATFDFRRPLLPQCRKQIVVGRCGRRVYEIRNGASHTTACSVSTAIAAFSSAIRASELILRSVAERGRPHWLEGLAGSQLLPTWLRYLHQSSCLRPCLEVCLVAAASSHGFDNLSCKAPLMLVDQLDYRLQYCPKRHRNRKGYVSPGTWLVGPQHQGRHGTANKSSDRWVQASTALPVTHLGSLLEVCS